MNFLRAIRLILTLKCEESTPIFRANGSAAVIF